MAFCQELALVLVATMDSSLIHSATSIVHGNSAKHPIYKIYFETEYMYTRFILRRNTCIQEGFDMIIFVSMDFFNVFIVCCLFFRRNLIV